MTRLTPTQVVQARDLAQRAATCALRFYQGQFDVTLKSDDSPVTQADLAVSALLEQQLPTVARFPVLSEENKPDSPQWTEWETYWLIDPIDGTRHFINRTGDYCVCIALIHRHEAIFGLIIAPTIQEMWLAQHGDGCSPTVLEKYVRNARVDFPRSDTALTVTLSATAMSARMQTLLSVLPEYTWHHRGSALKYIDIAEGKATLYPKMWDTCEWDSAAGQCILECAGGSVSRFDTGEPLRYGTQASLINPHFFAYRALPPHLVTALRARYPQVPPRQ